MPSPDPDEGIIPIKPKSPANGAPKKASAKNSPNSNGNGITKTRSPTNAPVRPRLPKKKAEPTLLSDFLLGRPTPGRKQRESIQMVKAEMKQSAVNKVQPPGGVKDRVKQWQKASAAVAVVDPAVPISEPDEILVEVEESSVDEEARQRIKHSQTRPGRRKSREDDKVPIVYVRSKSSPRKRVVSDEHWKKNRKQSPPAKAGGTPLPKDFLKVNAMNPPFEKKIADWVSRTEAEENDTRPRSRGPSKQAMSTVFSDDGVIETTGDVADTCMRKNLTRKDPVDDTCLQVVRKRSGDKVVVTAEAKTPRKKSERFLRPLDELEQGRQANSRVVSTEGEAEIDKTTMPTRRQRTVETPPRSIAEASLVSSAFSIADLPVGAEAGNMRKQASQRTPSLSVPNVLKRVLNEGRKIVHDTPEPPRGGLNQPPSIESWLNNTSDPFVDRKTGQGVDRRSPKPAINRRRSKDDESSEREPISESRETHKTAEKRNSRDLVLDEQTTPRKRVETPDSAETSPQSTPTGLKRAPATRSTRNTRKLPFKEALLDAFRGESVVERPRSSSPPSTSLDVGESDSDSTSRHDSRDRPQSGSPDPARRRSPPTLTDLNVEDLRRQRQPHQPPRRPPPTTGGHRLSTIASVDTLSTLSSLTETVSDVSRTTVTQATTNSGASASVLPRTSTSISRRSSTKPGLKRRLTKHSDLVSMLSLPDAAPLGRAASIRSARSVRTTRIHLDNATVKDLLQELAGDEVKYMRELKTLVDGVIPVLLTSVMSKRSASIKLFADKAPPDTKHIVEIGVSLERLKSIHKYIPLQDTEALVSWLHSAYNVYGAYIRAWRMGFQDVVVNLAPLSRKTSMELAEVPRNAQGDVVNDHGERVDVAYLLKRPLVRVKYILKIIKGLEKLLSTKAYKQVLDMYTELQEKTWQRLKEEAARFEDESANNTDASRARDPGTMALIDGVQIDRTRQVYAKDFFSFDITHSSGQRMECRIEVILRDKQSDKNDLGDVLMCAVDGTQSWLLFPPITRNNISARLGRESGQLVVMIRGFEVMAEYEELFTLKADNTGVAKEWVQMLGEQPVPPSLTSRKLINPAASELSLMSATTFSDDTPEIPIGERRYKERSSEARRLKASADLPDPSPKTHHAEEFRSHARAQDIPVVEIAQDLGSKEHSRSYSVELPYDQKPTSPTPFIYEHSPQEEETRAERRQGSPERTPPPPPVHRIAPKLQKNTISLDPPLPRARRSSSPLKNEYQPSSASEVSSPEVSEVSDISDSEYESSDTSDDELEAVELPETKPGISIYHKPAESLEDFPKPFSRTTTATTIPQVRTPEARPKNIRTLTASISCWNDKKGKWEDLYPGNCSIIIGPGLVEVYELTANYSAPFNVSGDLISNHEDASQPRPLIAQELTPIIFLRQSNSLDIEIQSMPTAASRLASTKTVRYRSLSPQACGQLYAAVHQARMQNDKYLALERERMLNAFGGHSYGAAVSGGRLRSWFGKRKNSYRAPERAISSSPPESTTPSSSKGGSAISRLSTSRIFNIGRSSVERPPSAFSSNSGSLTPPQTPPSLMGTTASDQPINFASDNIRIRLYDLETTSKWNDHGNARLAIVQPSPGMKQASSLWHGVEKRIIVTRNPINEEVDRKNQILLDVILGSGCFSRIGRTGICVNIWEDWQGAGAAPATGGVSGRTRKWCFQCGSGAEANWVYGLVYGRGSE